MSHTGSLHTTTVSLLEGCGAARHPHLIIETIQQPARAQHPPVNNESRIASPGLITPCGCFSWLVCSIFTTQVLSLYYICNMRGRFLAPSVLQLRPLFCSDALLGSGTFADCQNPQKSHRHEYTPFLNTRAPNFS